MRAIIFCFLCFVFNSGFSQEPVNEEELHFTSHAFSLCVTPKEKIIIVTRVGEIAYTDDVRSQWQKVSANNKEANDFLSGLTLDQANFFNNDTGFVSGFIKGGKEYDIIYHTTNGGKSWKPLKFGKGGWVDEATNLHNGEAWMSVSGDGIYYSSDYGFTWKHFDTPEPRQRFAKIFFTPEREGLIGSLYNLVAYTPDNCKSWKFLPTPLDQKAYVKTDPGNRPEISNVAILPAIFLVQQEELVFWSKKDTIEWKLLNGYTGFYTDAYNSAVYFKKGKSHILKSDNSLNILEEISLNCSIASAKCLGGKLFVFSGKELCRVDETLSASYFPLLTTQKKAIQPAHIGFGSGGTYGNLGNKVYTQQDYNGNWKYAFSLPFNMDSGSLSYEKEMIIFSKGDSIFYYSNLTKITEKVSRSQMFEDFAKHDVSEVVFSKASQGCFHGYSNSITYRRKSFEFAMHNEDVQEKSAKLPAAYDSFDDALVKDLMKQLPALVTALPTIEALNISERDYQRCKADILAFKNSIVNKSKKQQAFFMTNNNIDFDRLLNLVDTIKALKPERLNTMLYNLSNLWSTTTNSTRVSFINSNGQTLIISASYSEPNSFLFPWFIWFNGYTVSSTSPAITAFVNAAYPGLINRKDHVDILHSLVKQLYEQD